MDILRSISRINDINIFYEVVGEGHPIVLIHSEYTDNRIWDFQIRDFSKHYRIIRYDLRGHGKSAPPIEKISYYRDLFDLLNFLNIEKTYLLGASLSTNIAIDFSIMYPNMVEALILSGLSYNNNKVKYDNEEYSKLEFAELSMIKKDKDFKESINYILSNPIWQQKNDFVQSYLKDIFTESSLKWMLKKYLKEPNPPSIDRLSEINIPTIVINGQCDSLENKQVTNILEMNINNLITKTIEETGTLSNLHKPNQFNKIVLDFLSEL